MTKMPPAQVNLIQKNIYGDNKIMLTPIPEYLDILRNFPRIGEGHLACYLLYTKSTIRKFKIEPPR
jgi:hypothetical protein